MTVLVAYNDSPQGEAAMRAAAQEAGRRHTDLDVLVLTPQDPGTPVPAALAHLVDALAVAPRISYRSHDVDPADAIVQAAERANPDLVVIGSRKRSLVGTFLLGTTTQRVLLDSPSPVLVVKAEQH